MATENKRRFTVISNTDFEHKTKEINKHTNPQYQTNPLTEKLMKFMNNEGGRKFSVEDLLR